MRTFTTLISTCLTNKTVFNTYNVNLFINVSIQASIITSLLCGFLSGSSNLITISNSYETNMEYRPKAVLISLRLITRWSKWYNTSRIILTFILKQNRKHKVVFSGCWFLIDNRGENESGIMREQWGRFVSVTLLGGGGLWKRKRFHPSTLLCNLSLGLLAD